MKHWHTLEKWAVVLLARNLCIQSSRVAYNSLILIPEDTPYLWLCGLLFMADGASLSTLQAVSCALIDRRQKENAESLHCFIV